MSAGNTALYDKKWIRLDALREFGIQENCEILVFLKRVLFFCNEAISLSDDLEALLRNYQERMGTDFRLVLLIYSPEAAAYAAELARERRITEYFAAVIKENISIATDFLDQKNGSLILLSEKYGNCTDLEVTAAHEYGHLCHQKEMSWLWGRIKYLEREVAADRVAAKLCGFERTLRWLKSIPPNKSVSQRIKALIRMHERIGDIPA